MFKIDDKKLKMMTYNFITLLDFIVQYYARLFIKLAEYCYNVVLYTTALLEKQSKFPRYSIKCRGKHDTT